MLGQALSVLLCGTGVTSQLLVSWYSVSSPTTQTFLTYLLLGMVYGVVVATKSDFLSILRENWWKYIILGVVDVEANYLVVLAYKYTDLTTVQVKKNVKKQVTRLALMLSPVGHTYTVETSK